MPVVNELVLGGGAGLVYAGGGPMRELRSGRGESSSGPDTIAFIRPLPFASVAVSAGRALVVFRGTAGGGVDEHKPSASTKVVEASNDSRFSSL